MSHRIASTLPKIRVTVGHAPQKLKTAGIEPSSRARLEVLRKIVTRLVREERAEFQWNRAVEARPYVERLIQLGIERGQHDDYTAEMFDWWLPEKGLITKMHEVIIPRFEDREGPFTSIYRLPSARLQQHIQGKREFWKRYDIAVLEIDGNPFPPVIAEPEVQPKSLVNDLLKEKMALREWPEIEAIRGPKARHELVIKGPLKRDMELSYEELQKLAFYDGVPVNFISLTHCDLDHLHQSIINCTQLTRLTLANNCLTVLPDEIGTLSLLKFLDVSENKLASLPPTFGRLSKLESFIGARNQFTNESLFDFSNLEQLHVVDLSHNQLTALPKGLGSGKLTHLHTANFSNNQIIKIDDSFSALEAIKDLSLASNKLTAIPGPIGKLDKMRLLDLSSNPFKDSRFVKLANDKRTKILALMTYIKKNAIVEKEINVAATHDEPEMDVDNKDASIKIHTGKEQFAVNRLSSVKDIRPYLVCCVLEDLDISRGNFKKFINIQTKLHSSICGNRTIAAIGTHDLATFTPPLKYLALPPDELHITALHKKTPISARELLDALLRDAELARKRTKRNTLNPLHRYLDLVKNLPQLPCLTDSNGLVMSLAPVTNSDSTKLSETTTSVWVEVSSVDSLQICKDVMDQIIYETLQFCPSLSIGQVRITTDNDDLLSIYPDKSDLSVMKTERKAVE